MHPILSDIIVRFRAAQDRGVKAIVEKLGPTLGVRLPTSKYEWITICEECGLYTVQWVNGMGVYVHGYGIELVFKDVKIDFDWGNAGEPDGFDVWRLWHFVSSNKLNLGCTDYFQLKAWVEEAHQNGELDQNSLYDLYYSPTHRSRKDECNNS